MEIEKNGISEVVEEIHNTNKEIKEKYTEMEGLTNQLLKKMNQPPSPGAGYDCFVNTWVSEKLEYENYNPYFLGYVDGVFSILQDEDPDLYDNTGEHCFIELNPAEIPAGYLVSIINSLPDTLTRLLEKMEKEKERCLQAYHLVEKILEVI